MKDSIDFHKDSLQIYESALQSYRGHFLSSQSFMLAVGAIVLDKSIILVILVSIIAILQIWGIWFKIMRKKTITVDFYKFKMYKYFDSKGILKKSNKKPLTENTYINNKLIRKIVNYQMKDLLNQKKKFRNIRFTRIRIDVIIPCSFSIIWVAFILYTLTNK